MKKVGSTLLQKLRDRQRTPSHLFGGRVRTSTVVLVVAFFALWWTYATYRPQPEPPRSTTPPPGQVVPPGFVPDPGYTWVPRTRVQEQPVTTTPTPTPTTTTTPPPPTTTTTTTTPGLPCLLPPPFCPATTTPTTPPPEPGPTPPAR
jgi:cytoskeletal protein RodZ